MDKASLIVGISILSSVVNSFAGTTVGHVRAGSGEVTTIQIHLKAPNAANAAGIKVGISGAGDLPGMNERAMTDSDGVAQIFTRRTDYTYVVARRRDCDVTIGGAKAMIADGSDNHTFQRGRLDANSLGSTLSPDYFFSLPAAPGQTSAPGPLQLRPKTPGKARFLFCCEDSPVLRHTLRSDHLPMPYGKVWVTGDWNNFNMQTEDLDPTNGAKELFDDGAMLNPTDSDDAIGDGVYSRVLDLPPGDHAYVFFATVSSGPDSLQRDPYEESSRSVSVTQRWDPFPGVTGSTYTVKLTASVITVTKP